MQYINNYKNKKERRVWLFKKLNYHTNKLWIIKDLLKK